MPVLLLLPLLVLPPDEAAVLELPLLEQAAAVETSATAQPATASLRMENLELM